MTEVMCVNANERNFCTFNVSIFCIACKQFLCPMCSEKLHHGHFRKQHNSKNEEFCKELLSFQELGRSLNYRLNLLSSAYSKMKEKLERGFFHALNKISSKEISDVIKLINDKLKEEMDFVLRNKNEFNSSILNEKISSLKAEFVNQITKLEIKYHTKTNEANSIIRAVNLFLADSNNSNLKKMSLHAKKHVKRTNNKENTDTSKFKALKIS